MRKRAFYLACIVFLGLFLAVPCLWAQGEGSGQPEWNHFQLNEDVSFSLNGYLYLYHIRNNNCYYTDRNAAFSEVSAGLGLDFDFTKECSGQFRLVGTGIFGRYENYIELDDPEMAGDIETLVDLANVTWHTRLADNNLDITAGVQELKYGDGFLVMDGYTESRAVWTTPIRSFPAIKASLQFCEDTSLDLFAAGVRENHFQSYEVYLGTSSAYAVGGSLMGVDLHRVDEKLGTLDVAVFQTSQKKGSALGSDTTAISFRDEIAVTDRFTLTGEIVRQYGSTYVADNMIVADERNRRAWGGQVTGRYQISDEGYQPYAQARYVYFGGDRPGTRSTESFDPMFFGWADWGTWWIGDMTSFEVPHSNAKILCLELGGAPTDKSSLRFLYFNTSLNESIPTSNTRAWSQEVNVVYDYYFNDYVFAGIMGGAAIPRTAAEKFNGGDKTDLEVIAWFGFAF